MKPLFVALVSPPLSNIEMSGDVTVLLISTKRAVWRRVAETFPGSTERDFQIDASYEATRIVQTLPQARSELPIQQMMVPVYT